jgi:aminopeptidase-like protein
MTHDRAAEKALADDLLRELFPLCRSLTGDGVRQSLSILQRHAPLVISEYPSGTACFDWTIPREWNVSQAWIKDAAGRKVVDFAQNNLHLVSYSVPVRATLTWAELAPHLHTLPRLPQAIPYRTSYYHEDWGFCLSQEQYDALDRQGRYQVLIDSRLEDGSLSLAEARLPGHSGREYLLSTYCCHPSLANDNLSGMVLTTLLCRELAGRKLRHSYRFLVVPETIGAIAYLARHQEEMRQIAGGFVVTCVGGPGPLGYQSTFMGDHHIDRVAEQAFRELGVEPLIYAFAPNGSDERQYSSPGFRIPMGTICKDKYFAYDYYHTSLDDLNFVSAGQLVQTLEVYLKAVEILEQDEVLISSNLDCEPQLGRRGLYPRLGGKLLPRPAAPPAPAGGPGQTSPAELDTVDALLWIMFLADGEHSLLDMARASGAPFGQLRQLATVLLGEGLLRRPQNTAKDTAKDAASHV